MGSENVRGADNQQERLGKPQESSETIRWISKLLDNDIVPTAWRHAGVTVKEGYPLKMNLSKISSEIPCRVSSDLHEWRNDSPTVSTRDPAKMTRL